MNVRARAGIVTPASASDSGVPRGRDEHAASSATATIDTLTLTGAVYKNGMDGADAPELTLDGTLERVVFRAEDTGFTVARFTTRGGADLTTVVGTLLSAHEGDALRLFGRWVEDKKYGKQFKIERWELLPITTPAGITNVLASRRIKGVGPEMAKRLVDRFGDKTLEIIERTPERLTEVAGIGTARAAAIAATLAERRHEQNVMVFLHSHGASGALAARIVKKYGTEAIVKIRENPYRLATEVWGIGFKTADAIAIKLGIARDDPKRLEAGLRHALETLKDDGHTHAPDDTLYAAAAELLGIERDKLVEPLAVLALEGHVIRESLGDRGPCTSLLRWWKEEHDAAASFAELVATPARSLTLDVEAAIRDFEVAGTLELAPQQRRAVIAAAVEKCVVVTGGPGVGKTTIVRAIVHLARLQHRTVALAAPTGRAAKRLTESTASEATTVHRLLEYQPHEDRFARGPGEPVEADVVVIDEASMVDIALFRAIVGALRSDAQLVLVGDVDQLPSVGPGAVLEDVIKSGAATVVRLTEIFRQAAASHIIVNAHKINSGNMPELDAPGADRDFFFIGREDPALARATVVELVAERIPAKFGLDPMTGIQVLVPMHRGDLGTAALNAALQERLNPSRTGYPEILRGERAFRTGDKVMQLKNDYDKGVFNGDIGVIASIRDGDGALLTIDFGDGRTADYERSELDQLVHAFAVSIHKSQGSEYPAVVIPIATQHYMMLQRSLLYTAVTRGKRLVVIVGSRRAVSMAVRNSSARARFTWLAERIRTLTT
jgi:exodeoxyribonuclease V alpha subunit